MTYISPTLSSPVGVQRCTFDLTGKIGSTETISTVTVTSKDTSKLTVGAAVVNSSSITKEDGTVIDAGKAVEWTATVVQQYIGTVAVEVRIQGSLYFDKTFTIEQPISLTVTD